MLDDLMQQIGELESRARALAIDDARRIETLGATGDARAAADQFQRSVARAWRALESQLDPDQEARTGGWEIR